ncbi:endonuclease domain-containing protein [Sphingopyxis terrae subsp. ummariensis]
MRRIPPEMTDRARQLRNEATPAERIIWRLLSSYRPAFTRQLVIGNYIIDLACREARLGIEFDGSQHLERQSYDDRRTAFLESEGWRVLRVWNNDVLANPEGVARLILEEAAECLGGTHPQPLPCREGRVRRPRYE